MWILESPLNHDIRDILDQEHKSRNACKEGKLVGQVPVLIEIKLETHDKSNVSNDLNMDYDPQDTMKSDLRVGMISQIAQFPYDVIEPMDKGIK